MATYKLIQKRNPMKPAEAPKWYAISNSAQQLSGRTMVKEATTGTTYASLKEYRKAKEQPAE